MTAALDPFAGHTPGPWSAEQAPCGTRTGLISIPTRKPVAMLGVTAALNPADVAMVQAAPDLVAINRLLAASTLGAILFASGRGLDMDGATEAILRTAPPADLANSAELLARLLLHCDRVYALLARAR